VRSSCGATELHLVQLSCQFGQLNSDQADLTQLSGNTSSHTLSPLILSAYDPRARHLIVDPPMQDTGPTNPHKHDKIRYRLMDRRLNQARIGRITRIPIRCAPARSCCRRVELNSGKLWRARVAPGAHQSSVRTAKLPFVDYELKTWRYTRVSANTEGRWCEK